MGVVRGVSVGGGCVGVERLERVMWRLRRNNPGKRKVLNRELHRAIMYECGTDPRTYKFNRKALMILGWIESYGKTQVWLTDKDLTS